jgi:hypothetical protein
VEAQQDVVNLLEEVRETALVRSASYQQTLRRYHEKKVQGRTLEVSELVLRTVQSMKDAQLIIAEISLSLLLSIASKC